MATAPAAERFTLAARLARMHDTMCRHVDSGRLPGLVTLIGRWGQEHLDAVGTLAFDRGAASAQELRGATSN